MDAIITQYSFDAKVADAINLVKEKPSVTEDSDQKIYSGTKMAFLGRIKTITSIRHMGKRDKKTPDFKVRGKLNRISTVK